MVKVRQDAWSHEDDLLLAETVLRHIREGSTQLNAFEEVGDKLNRTAAACGFRWNAEVRQNYEKAIDLAKRQRKQRKQSEKQKQAVTRKMKTVASKASYSNADSPSIDSIIAQLQELKSNEVKVNAAEVEQLKEENDRLKEDNMSLERDLEKLKNEYETLQEDYQTFISIMERARKMVVLDDDSSLSSPAFKMEKNGNLQQIAK
ncbi:RsfA family transcriptional regulator [Aquisalibacillus elongatus]|uniref:Prespore-specific regulator n=1 Tax=Aquisalibacillus elongatus TaxID=485577 RepID=A0A3N5C7T3_9BACI|nr:RsfA family transcriptional regulator [Aquisalibacillus elongatus]RPF55532.1 prespore-specific regulator [Aquisalibacillus elongatus]